MTPCPDLHRARAIEPALQALEYRLVGLRPHPTRPDPHVFEVQGPDGLWLCTERDAESLVGPDAVAAELAARDREGDAP